MGNRNPTRTTRIGRPRKPSDHPFARWLDRCGITYAAIAEACDCSTQTITNLRNGHVKPSGELASAIAYVSRGAVPASTWWPRKERKRARRRAA